ncbi:Cof-type HAD-IIB family hydrolase [Virgibacillus senegalensis]|uniref:Cof-type HAD-IIB family hydrolase n=1 Tax=Virgibacillus senegalensis TaxID=1499679 RepID=UPI00069DC59D|nr:Cof-type HAD-IIB family hydrolase [Virgibacillus senegalensis]
MADKIVFLDIDGTIVDHEKKIPLETKLAVKKLKAKGIHVAIATGRAPFMIEGIRRDLDIDSYVCFNGQYVVLDGKTVYENPLTMEQLTALTKKAKQSGHAMVYLNHEGMRASVKEDPFIADSLSTLKFAYPEVDPEYFYKKEIYQALLFCENNEETAYDTDDDSFTLIRWHEYSCDVLPGGGSKAVGVNKLIEASGLNIEDAYAFGDGLNDIEMIKHVGTGVAMGNAVPELKAVADHVIGEVDDAGLAKGMAQLGLL